MHDCERTRHDHEGALSGAWDSEEEEVRLADRRWDDPPGDSVAADYPVLATLDPVRSPS